MSYAETSGAGPPEGKSLNRFGRWIVALNKILGTTQDEMAAKIGYSKGSFSATTRGDGYSMSRQTFRALVKEYQELAERRGIPLPITSFIFLSAAWIGGENGSAESDVIVKGEDQSLENIEMFADLIEERNQLRKENERLKKRPFRTEMVNEIAVLEKELERLRLENTWLKMQRENS